MRLWWKLKHTRCKFHPCVNFSSLQLQKCVRNSTSRHGPRLERSAEKLGSRFYCYKHIETTAQYVFYLNTKKIIVSLLLPFLMQQNGLWYQYSFWYLEWGGSSFFSWATTEYQAHIDEVVKVEDPSNGNSWWTLRDQRRWALRNTSHCLPRTNGRVISTVAFIPSIWMQLIFLFTFVTGLHSEPINSKFLVMPLVRCLLNVRLELEWWTTS